MVIGCGRDLTYRFISPTRAYNTYVGSGFTKEQEQMVRDAMMEWQTSTRETVRFNEYRIVNYSQSVIVILPSYQNELARKYGKNEIGRDNWFGSDNEAFIAIDLDKRDFYETTLHEIGHALGLDHDDAPAHEHKQVMNKHSDLSSDHLTCLDMRAFCRVWDCNPNNLPLCQDGQR